MTSAASAAALAAWSCRSVAGEPSPGHVVLLGDSIFDNAVYVGDDPAVVDQLRGHLPAGWRASLLAVDGSVASDVRDQLCGLPADATHLVVSVGGNDALRSEGVLGRPVARVAEALLVLAEVRAAFAELYNAMLDAVTAAGKPTALCTIYDPNFDDPDRQQAAVIALTAFNDVIVRAAVRRRVPVLDLRVLFDSSADYANPIEPSATGGDKLARAIAGMIAEHDFARPRTVLHSSRPE
ncbi:MAG: SGNH/GDSL hydrolase family protein [Planctomycetes bacterium]|nr:SGNH/GDSL hydrolase family protein [Planctomycetota bacterium]